MPLNDEARNRFDRIDGAQAELFKLQRDTLQRLNDHVYQSGVRDTETKASVDSSHAKIDDHIETHKEKRGWFAALWLVALGGFFTATWEWIRSHFK